MPESAVTCEDALRRAESAQRRVLQFRSQMKAEIELRNVAIVDAYELGGATKAIARRVGIGETTVMGIVAAN
jgi:DNA-binding NarL/FixJ family response regulator